MNQTYLQQVIEKTAGQNVLDFNLSWEQQVIHTEVEPFSLSFLFF